MLLDQIFFEICLGTCAGSHKVKLSLHFHALGDLVYFVHYQLPYVSKSCLTQTWSCFWFCFLLSNYCIVHVRKSMEQDRTFWTQGSSECFFCFT